MYTYVYMYIYLYIYTYYIHICIYVNIYIRMMKRIIFGYKNWFQDHVASLSLYMGDGEGVLSRRPEV